MPPSITLPDSDLIKESERIKEELLKVEVNVARAASSERAAQMKGLREKLGYSRAKAVDSTRLVDARIIKKTPVITPDGLSNVLQITETAAVTTEQTRQDVINILAGKDNRMVVIVGPCSIHDPLAALEYAEKVKSWRKKYGSNLVIIMRSYMEKPRTEKDWKGLVYDPHLDGSEDINLGLILTRLLSCRIANLGVPIAMERLNALTPQYLNGLVAYDAIGARNTTDQKSREYASGTSSPVGFKNTPEGSLLSAVQAVISAKAEHAFLGMSSDGVISQINTVGNETGHVILRGDQNGPNYSSEHIAEVKKLLKQYGLQESIIVDASHGNSGKKAENQIKVIKDVAAQVSGGEKAIIGVMIESNLVEGAQKQKNPDGTFKKPHELTYGQSITDECVGLDETDRMLAILDKATAARLKKKNK